MLIHSSIATSSTRPTTSSMPAASSISTTRSPAYDRQAAFAHVAGIYDTLVDLFRRAKAEGVSPLLMADCMAEERLAVARHDGLTREKIAAVG